jgi:antitoxin FitA
LTISTRRAPIVCNRDSGTSSQAQALKRRAAKRNHSTEQEHREILQSALQGPKRRHLATVLKAIPNVGKDSDFEREQSDKRT